MNSSSRNSLNQTKSKPETLVIQNYKSKNNKFLLSSLEFNNYNSNSPTSEPKTISKDQNSKNNKIDSNKNPFSNKKNSIVMAGNWNDSTKAKNLLKSKTLEKFKQDSDNKKKVKTLKTYLKRKNINEINEWEDDVSIFFILDKYNEIVEENKIPHVIKDIKDHSLYANKLLGAAIKKLKVFDSLLLLLSAVVVTLAIIDVSF